MNHHEHPLFRACPKHCYNPYVKQRHVPITHEEFSVQPNDIDAVVYHYPCPDGFLSAVIAFSVRPHALFLPVTHSSKLSHIAPQIKGRTVLFVDIAPSSPSDLKQWEMADYLILDHHATNRDTLSAVSPRNAKFDMNSSGCGLAFQYFYPGQIPPVLLKYIELYDLWKHHNEPDCAEFLLGFHNIVPDCVMCWDSVLRMKNPHRLFVPTGHVLMKPRNKSIHFFASHADLRLLNGRRLWVVNVTDRSIINEIGYEICRKNGDDAALMWYYNHKQHVCICRLRSQSMDVGLLAKELGGGGHTCSSSFKFQGSNIEKLFD